LQRSKTKDGGDDVTTHKTFTDVDGTVFDVQIVTLEPGVYKATFKGDNGREFRARIRSGTESLLDIAERIIRNYYME
jgi:hypothetical protein